MKKIYIYLAVLISPLIMSLDDPDQRYFDIAKNMEILSSVYSEVNRMYVEDVNPNELFKTGVEAMLSSLDPYTNYIAEEDIEDFRFISTGEYGGIGSIIGTRNGKVLVLMPYEGYPAYKAGLKIGDEIIEIDGDNVEGKNTNEISRYLKGQAKTQVTVKIKRYGESGLLEIDLIREKVSVKNVPFVGMITDDIGYFKLTTFTRDASANVEDAVKELKSKGAKKIVFDLRGNGGGLLKEAIKISNLFIPKNKEVVSTRGKLERWNTTYGTEDQPLDADIPMVVLINGRSASASEIVSGVLQDYDRAVLIGNKTFGKGLVQQTVPTAYNSQVKVTVAKYYIPSGRCIQAIDYSKKDENGEAVKIPDSLLVEFETASGRKVLDGNGIYPDIEIEDKETPAVLIGLYNESYLFDYATEYYYSHDTIAPAKEFNATKEYDKLLPWLKQKDFKFDISSDIALKEFEEVAQEDGISDNLKNALTQLKSEIEESKSNDLLQYKTEIIEELEKEIISRYYLQTGAIEADFDDDQDIQQAVEVLNNSQKYNKILSGK